MEAGMSSDDSVGLRYGDWMADATEGVVAADAASDGNDEVVFAAGDWVAKGDFGGDGGAIKDFRLLDDLRLKDGPAHWLLPREMGAGQKCYNSPQIKEGHK